MQAIPVEKKTLIRCIPHLSSNMAISVSKVQDDLKTNMASIYLNKCKDLKHKTKHIHMEWVKISFIKFYNQQYIHSLCFIVNLSGEIRYTWKYFSRCFNCNPWYCGLSALNQKTGSKEKQPHCLNFRWHFIYMTGYIFWFFYRYIF